MKCPYCDPSRTTCAFTTEWAAIPLNRTYTVGMMIEIMWHGQRGMATVIEISVDELALEIDVDESTIIFSVKKGDL